MQLDTLLARMYQNDAAVDSLEKTASDNFLDALRTDNTVEENPYANMSTEELAQLALKLEAEEEQEKTASAQAEPGEDAAEAELEKVAFDMLGGQIMAHSMVNEFELIKVATANGLCRVCKENPFDVQGSTICSACQAE
jgi:hypothetical protein